jgi:hypothetical protein
MTQLELPFNEPPIASTLNERGKSYGDFTTQANLSQTLSAIWKQHYYQTHHNEQLPPFILEAVEMILHKLARAANGNPLQIDTYRDVAGYAQLVVDALQQYPGAMDTSVTTFPVVTKEEIALTYS